MVTIYHNPRCSKSRETLAILENTNTDFKVVKYLDDPLSVKDLKEIISLLQMSPQQLVRKNEAIWKETYSAMQLTDDELIQIMVDHPKLIERPIIVHGKKAAIGRPPLNILEIL